MSEFIGEIVWLRGEEGAQERYVWFWTACVTRITDTETRHAFCLGCKYAWSRVNRPYSWLFFLTFRVLSLVWPKSVPWHISATRFSCLGSQRDKSIFWWYSGYDRSPPRSYIVLVRSSRPTTWGTILLRWRWYLWEWWCSDLRTLSRRALVG